MKELESFLENCKGRQYIPMEAAKEQKASVSPEAHVLSVKSVFNPSIRRCKRSPPPSLIGGTSLPSASSPKMPLLAGGAGLGCSPPSPCPGGLGASLFLKLTTWE